MRLLGPDDQAPVLIEAFGDTRAPWLLTADHAGNAVPRVLRDLGMSRPDLEDHIGIDIGIWPVTVAVARELRSVAVGQAYSRLVIDCNRRPGTSASIPTVSDGRAVAGNVGADAGSRLDEIFAPYHAAIETRLRDGLLICAMHSFTRSLAGRRRAVDIGVIHGPKARLADAVIGGLADCGLRVVRNSPYQIDFAGDYTLPVHGEARAADYVELEICQDLIGDEAGQARLARIVGAALSRAQLKLSNAA